MPYIKIQKTLCDEVFYQTSKSFIEFNNEINIEIDLDNISPANIISTYKGDFLGNFMIKIVMILRIGLQKKRRI